jgi:hypothetical protein
MELETGSIVESGNTESGGLNSSENHFYVYDNNEIKPANQGINQNAPIPQRLSTVLNNPANQGIAPIPQQQPVAPSAPVAPTVPAQNAPAAVPAQQPPVYTGDVVLEMFNKDGQFDHGSALEYIKKYSEPQGQPQPIPPVQPQQSQIPPAQQTVPATPAPESPKQEWEYQEKYATFGLDALEGLLKEGMKLDDAIKYIRNGLAAEARTQRSEYEREKRWNEKHEELQKSIELRDKEFKIRETAVESQKQFYDNMAKLATKAKFPSVESFQKALVNVETGSGKFLGALFEAMNPEFKTVGGDKFVQAMDRWMVGIMANPEIAEGLSQVVSGNIMARTHAMLMTRGQVEQEKITKANMQQSIPKTGIGPIQNKPPEQQVDSSVRNALSFVGRQSIS